MKRTFMMVMRRSSDDEPGCQRRHDQRESFRRDRRIGGLR